MKKISKNGVYGTFSGNFKFFETFDIKDYQKEMGEMNATQRAWAKMIVNSHYPPYAGNGTFRLYDPEVANNITEQGSKILEELKEKMKRK
jgi:DNA polymerase elongation subunit (family B)